MTHPLDNPKILQNLFFPRQARMNIARPQNAVDGTVATDDGAEIGYRLYVHAADAPLVLYFHGNGEVASDYDMIAPMFHRVGLSLLVADYRGYGWSSDTPKVTSILPDAEAVLDALPSIMAANGIAADVRRVVMGRSLGSGVAAHVAYRHADALHGVIIESGYADTPSLFVRLGIPIPEADYDSLNYPLNNTAKLAASTCRLLVLHGENDTLLPVENGQRLYDASGATDKLLVRIAGAGHNDIMMVGGADYFNAIRDFVNG
jgi:alpha-beta hydrolase superfamily lysophospholipase